MRETIIGTIPKSRKKNIRVTVSEYQDMPYVYIHIINIGEDGKPVEGFIPWLSARPETIRDLIPILDRAAKFAEDGGRGKGND
jgi:hypothetical protein